MQKYTVQRNESILVAPRQTIARVATTDGAATAGATNAPRASCLIHYRLFVPERRRVAGLQQTISKNCNVLYMYYLNPFIQC